MIAAFCGNEVVHFLQMWPADLADLERACGY